VVVAVSLQAANIDSKTKLTNINSTVLRNLVMVCFPHFAEAKHAIKQRVPLADYITWVMWVSQQAIPNILNKTGQISKSVTQAIQGLVLTLKVLRN
jgi:hypothetical protein